MLQENETVYTVLRHVSRSGMLRYIDAYVMRNNEPRRIIQVLNEDQLKQVLDMFKYVRDKEGFKISGSGMDIGYHLVYTISQILFNDGYKLKQKWL